MESTIPPRYPRRPILQYFKAVTVMKIRECVLRIKHPDTLRSMAGLVSIYRSQEHWDIAEVHGENALRSARLVLDDENPITGSIIFNLVVTYRNRERLAEAEKLGEDALNTIR